MGMDMHFMGDQIEKSIKEMRERLNNIRFNEFLKEFRTLCLKYQLFLTMVSVNNEYKLFEYWSDEPKESMDKQIYDAYMGGALSSLGTIDRLYFTVYSKTGAEES